jgi:hypothetical protein
MARLRPRSVACGCHALIDRGHRRRRPPTTTEPIVRTSHCGVHTCVYAWSIFASRNSRETGWDTAPAVAIQIRCSFVSNRVRVCIRVLEVGVGARGAGRRGSPPWWDRNPGHSVSTGIARRGPVRLTAPARPASVRRTEVQPRSRTHRGLAFTTNQRMSNVSGFWFATVITISPRLFRASLHVTTLVTRTPSYRSPTCSTLTRRGLGPVNTP